MSIRITTKNKEEISGVPGTYKENLYVGKTEQGGSGNRTICIPDGEVWNKESKEFQKLPKNQRYRFKGFGVNVAERLQGTNRFRERCRQLEQSQRNVVKDLQQRQKLAYRGSAQRKNGKNVVSPKHMEYLLSKEQSKLDMIMTLNSEASAKSGGPRKDGNVLSYKGLWRALKRIKSLCTKKELRDYRESCATGEIGFISQILIPKPDDAEAMRPIAPSSHYNKSAQAGVKRMIEGIIMTKRVIGKHLSSYQNGFAPKDSTEKAIQELWKVVFKRPECFGISLDVSGAFDNIAREPIIEAWRASGVPVALIEYMVLLLNAERRYSDGYEIVDKGATYPKGKGRKGTIYQEEYGTPQGGVLSPWCFKIGVKHWLKKLDETLASHDKWKHLRLMVVMYADDAVIWGLKSKEEAQEFLDWLEVHNRPYGLPINKKKTEIVSLDPDETGKLGLTPNPNKATSYPSMLGWIITPEGLALDWKHVEARAKTRTDKLGNSVLLQYEKNRLSSTDYLIRKLQTLDVTKDWSGLINWERELQSYEELNKEPEWWYNNGDRTREDWVYFAVRILTQIRYYIVPVAGKKKNGWFLKMVRAIVDETRVEEVIDKITKSNHDPLRYRLNRHFYQEIAVGLYQETKGATDLFEELEEDEKERVNKYFETICKISVGQVKKLPDWLLKHLTPLEANVTLINKDAKTLNQKEERDSTSVGDKVSDSSDTNSLLKFIGAS